MTSSFLSMCLRQKTLTSQGHAQLQVSTQYLLCPHRSAIIQLKGKIQPDGHIAPPTQCCETSKSTVEIGLRVNSPFKNHFSKYDKKGQKSCYHYHTLYDILGFIFVPFTSFYFMCVFCPCISFLARCTTIYNLLMFSTR